MSANIAYNHIDSLVNDLADILIKFNGSKPCLPTYLEFRVRLLLEAFPHSGVVGVQELERLGHRGHRARGVLDFIFDIVASLHSLGKFSAIKLLDKKVDLVFKGLVFLILIIIRKLVIRLAILLVEHFILKQLYQLTYQLFSGE